MKGKIILIPVTDPKVGMKVIWDKSLWEVDAMKTEEGKKLFEEQVWDPAIRYIRRIEKNYFAISAQETKDPYVAVRVPLSELKQIAVEYQKFDNDKHMSRCGELDNSYITATLPIPIDDYVRCLPLINKDIDFVKWDGGRHVIGEPEFEPVAWVQQIPKKRKLIEITDEDVLMLGKLWHEEYEWKVEERNDTIITIKCEDYRLYLWLVYDDFVDGEELYHGKTNIEAHGGESEPASLYYSVIDMVDYLRSKGYDLPNKFEKKNGRD